MAEFEEAYTREVLPSLNGLGFQASAEPRRTTVDSVFSRLFEFESPLEMTRKIGKTQEEGELQKDVQWRQAMLALGSTFGIRRSDGQIQHKFINYRSPAGPGRTSRVRVKRGRWMAFSAKDGLRGK